MQTYTFAAKTNGAWNEKALDINFLLLFFLKSCLHLPLLKAVLKVWVCMCACPMNHLFFLMCVLGTQSMIGGFQMHHYASVVNTHIHTACISPFTSSHLLLHHNKNINQGVCADALKEELWCPNCFVLLSPWQLWIKCPFPLMQHTPSCMSTQTQGIKECA